MPVRILDVREAAALRAAPFTYAPVGGSFSTTPEGYSGFSRSRVLRRHDFDGAVHDLLTWRVHEKAGLSVSASDSPLRDGTVVRMRLGRGPFAVMIPCRVVEVIDTDPARGFTYGTLPGHPEEGEERFYLEQLRDGRVCFTIKAFSRPASTLARAGGPLTRYVQRAMTTRYLHALDRL
jgi:uncharacterized protein (UPF0548 family)